MRRVGITLSFALLLVATVTTVTSADPPRPGTTNSSLTESEEATLWSRQPADEYVSSETYKDAYGENRTTIHDIANGSDLTFSEPPSTASRWTQYTHGQFEPGDASTSRYPPSAETRNGSYVREAHATIFAVSPSTQAHVAPGDRRFYVPTEGTVLGVVDYHLAVPSVSDGDDTSDEVRLESHDVVATRLYADGQLIANGSGSQRPIFEYTVEDASNVTLEADVRVTLDPEPNGTNDSGSGLVTETVTVSDRIEVDVYTFRAEVYDIEFPDGRMGTSIYQDEPWQGYTLDESGRTRVRGVWRFFTARDTDWDTVVESSSTNTTRTDSEALPPLVSMEGLYLYGIGGLVLVVVVANVRSWYLDRRHDDPELASLLDDETLERADVETRVLDEIAERHQDVLAPAGIEWETRNARVGEQWTSTLYVSEYPDAPKDGYLSGLFEVTDVEFDVTTRIEPRNQGLAREELQRVADDIQAEASLERTVRGDYLQERADQARRTYKAVENGQKVFDQELTITVRAATKDELRRSVKQVKAALREQPAQLEPKTAICTQDLAIQSAAPVGPAPLDRSAVTLGGAVGALLTSPHNASILEEGGVAFGIHKDTRSPLVIDPYAREDGYAMFTVGDPGSGKSFGSKQNFIRTIEQDPDRIGVILEPLNNWAGVAEALGGQRVTVGGTLGLNPLEIKPTPEHVLEARGDDASPLKERRNRAVSFFTNFFAHRDVELGDRRTTLELAIGEAYERKGITDDVSTHDRESPTVRDVLDILEEMSAAPEDYVVRVEAESEKIANDSVWLLNQLRPFAAGGQLENLGRQSEFDIRDEKVVYLDLQQRGGSIGGQTSLIMELLISLVYERAKETPKEVVFVVDEARYRMQDAATLSYLETIFRHHRHHDLSIRLVTQTVDEFFQHDVSKIIIDQAPSSSSTSSTG